MSVVIAGCGDLGTEVGLRLATAGHRVVGLRRRAEMLPAPIVGVGADLTGRAPTAADADAPGELADALDDALAGTDVDGVVYAATAGGRSPAAYRSAYVDGPANLLDALDRLGARPRRIVFVSSTAVYGVSDGSEVDEATPTEPTSATGPVLVEAERALHARRPDAIVFRLAGIYGPGRTRLIDQVREGSAVIPDPPVHTNRIHRDDAAEAIVHLLGIDAPEAVYLGVDHDPAERGEVLRFLADELGLPHPPTGPDQRSRGGDKRCRNDRLVGSGFAFAYPTFREGYRAMLAGIGTRHP